jgi:histidine ammonia-lyase
VSGARGAVEIDGKSLDLESIEAVARHGARVTVTEEARRRVARSRAFV